MMFRGASVQLRFAQRTLLLFLVVSLAGTGCHGQQRTDARRNANSVSSRKRATMIKVIPNSPSLVLRSTHILLIQIESSQPGQWVTDPNGNLKRTVDLTIRLEEILKGDVREPPGGQVRITVEQFGRPGTRYYAVPGVWSDQPIEPGAKLVAFCHGASNSAAELLCEPSCQQLLPPEKSLADVRLALQAEAKDLTVPDALKLAEPSAASLDYIFAEYVAAKLADSLLGDVGIFEALMKFIENPSLSGPTRSALLTFVYSKVTAQDPAPKPYGQKLAVMMFHLIALPQASALHNNIISVFLPNLLGLRGGATRKKAEALFQEIPVERQKAERILREYRGEASTNALMKWLRE